MRVGTREEGAKIYFPCPRSLTFRMIGSKRKLGGGRTKSISKYEEFREVRVGGKAQWRCIPTQRNREQGQDLQRQETYDREEYCLEVGFREQVQCLQMEEDGTGN